MTNEFFRTVAADYERHNRTLRNPGFWALFVYRFGRWSEDQGGAVRRVARPVYELLRTGSEVLLASVVDREAELGKTVHLVHGRVRIGRGSVIGERVGIMHDVAIGAAPDRAGEPTIGNDVFIGAGAKVLGPVTIGDKAWIAANSLVVTDVPPGATAIGVPAKVMRYNGRREGSEGEGTQAPREEAR